MEQTLNKEEQKQWVIVPCEFILLQVLNNKTFCETANENPPVENLPVQKNQWSHSLSLPKSIHLSINTDRLEFSVLQPGRCSLGLSLLNQSATCQRRIPWTRLFITLCSSFWRGPQDQLEMKKKYPNHEETVTYSSHHRLYVTKEEKKPTVILFNALVNVSQLLSWWQVLLSPDV